MQVPKYLRPVRDKKNYQASVGERFIRLIVFAPIIVLLCVPVALVGAVFFLPSGLGAMFALATYIPHSIETGELNGVIVLVGIAISVLLLWKISYIIYDYFII